MSMFKAVVFDLDGTLVNSLRDLAESVNRALSQHGLPGHAVEDYRWMVGEGIRMLVQRALPPERQDLLEVVLAAQREYYRSHICDYSAPYPGIPELIKDLRDKPLQLGVLSNKTDALVKSVVEQLLPDHPFAVVRGACEGGPLKPDPSSLLEILSQWQVTAQETLYVGDSAIDMQTATRAGAYAVGVTWGFRPREELLSNGSQTLIDRPGDFLSLLD